MRPEFTISHGPSAETFFTEVCAKLLRVRASKARHKGGRFAFHLKGTGGGTWIIDFTKALVVKNPSDRDADVLVSMTAADFEALLTRDLDIDDALSTNRIEIFGEPSRLAELGPILGPLGPRD